MPWKVSDVMEQRFRLIEQFNKGEYDCTELARRFGVSRKTLYKWLNRYKQSGLEGLRDHSRRPLNQPTRTLPDKEQWVLDLRQTHPGWGPKKLKDWLERNKPDQSWPARSTIGLILERNGLNGHRRQRRRTPPPAQPLAHAREANHVWTIDFKGWFRCADHARCDPLTVCDAASRYLLGCRCLAGYTTEAVQRELTRIFQTYGLPDRMRSDNGSPFASTSPGGLSALSVWWVRLGILPERIAPGHPEQNGRHERMHRTLKAETATPPAPSLRAQQERFDRFLHIYNQQRPHEALGGATPADHYQSSARELPAKLTELEYPAGMELRQADQAGKIRWKQARCRVGKPLAYEVVGIEAVDDGVWRVWFGPVLLGLLDERKKHSRAAKKGSSHWPPLQSPSGLLARQPVASDDQEDGRKV